jgi:hypothetical protein
MQVLFFCGNRNPSKIEAFIVSECREHFPSFSYSFHFSNLIVTEISVDQRIFLAKVTSDCPLNLTEADQAEKKLTCRGMITFTALY